MSNLIRKLTREQRKRPKVGVGTKVFISFGRLQRRDPNYGLPVNCYLCATPHNGSGLAQIEDEHTTHVPLCDACLAGENLDQRVLRKYWNVPGLDVREGGTWDPNWDKPQ